jgi:hypothetical protein
MLAASLSLAALSLGSLLTSAAPIEPRIVETIECSPLDATYTLDGLFWASAAVDATLVPVGIAADGNATWAPSASDLEGQWTFEVCNSTIIKQCVCNGRLLAPHRGGVVCLGQVTDEWPTFSSCASPPRRTSIENLWYGHLTFEPTGADEALCLTAEFPYNDERPHLAPCSFSDDSGQYLQTWLYQVGLPARAGLKGTSFLRFVGPAGSVNN